MRIELRFADDVAIVRLSGKFVAGSDGPFLRQKVADLIDAVNRSQIIVEGGTADFKLEMNKAEIAATAAVLRAEPVAPAIEAFPPAAAPER